MDSARGEHPLVFFRRKYLSSTVLLAQQMLTIRLFLQITFDIDLTSPQNSVGLSNILYSERFEESSKFFFRREPGKRAHR